MIHIQIIMAVLGFLLAHTCHLQAKQAKQLAEQVKEISDLTGLVIEIIELMQHIAPDKIKVEIEKVARMRA